MLEIYENKKTEAGKLLNINAFYRYFTFIILFNDSFLNKFLFYVILIN